MKTLESIGGAGNSAAQLYYELGKLLEREMEALKKRNDRAGLERTQEAYQKFLKALVASKSGQTYQSLQWAGRQPAQARRGQGGRARSSTRILDVYAKDPQFLKTPNAADRLLLRPAQAGRRAPEAGRLLRGRDHAQRDHRAEQAARSSPRWRRATSSTPGPRPSKGPGPRPTTYWKTLALRLDQHEPQAGPSITRPGTTPPSPSRSRGKPDLARQTLASVMRLSPDARRAPR